MPGYNLCRSDHSSNTKRGRTCLCYKNCVPLKIADIQYLQECINFKKKISEKIYNFVALYHSSSHSQDEFERFPKNLQQIFRPFCNFNAQSNLWFKNDKTIYEGSKINGIAS